MSERSGIEIDYCPQCRGVWLDRGELDKIIDRASGASAQPVAPAPQYQQPQPQPRSDDRGHTQRPDRKKRESWLSDLFD